jgi:hypothetical protein
VLGKEIIVSITVLVFFLLLPASPPLIIWLLIKGEYWLVILGFSAAFVMPKIYCLFYIPSYLLSKLLAKPSVLGKKVLALTLGSLNCLYLHFLILKWVYFVFDLYLSHAPRVGLGILLGWSSSVSIAPLAYMGSKDPDYSPEQIGSTLGLTAAIFYSLFLIASYFLQIGLGMKLAGVTALWIFFSLYHARLAILAYNEEHKPTLIKDR